MHPALLTLLAVPVLLVGQTIAQDPSRREGLERAAAVPQAAAPAPPTAGPFRLVDVSLDILGAAGVSTERDAVLADLEGGGHDPKKRGFTLQQAELALEGAVDPWFTAKAYVITLLDAEEGETLVELEEAFLLTQQLPAGLQLKAGTYFTEFGRLNARHPHQWDWQNQPIVNTRLFGADGMRGPGARVSWLVPTDTFAELTLGAHNANGETMTSFLANDEVYGERPIGGRAFTEREVRSLGDLVYNVRGVVSFDVGDSTTVGFGASALFGPNATGDDADTTIVGADFMLRWRPANSQRGYPFVKLEGEIAARAFDAQAQTDESGSVPVDVPGDELRDEGGYVQALYGFAPGLAAGVRFEMASGSGDNYDPATQTFVRRDTDPYRADRMRISPLLAWHPSEYSRIRLQYDYDDSDHLADEVHSVWLGFEVLIGAHPPHGY